MIFVTGGTGLLGSHLLVELTQQYDHITAIYRNKSKIETVKKCFDYYLKSDATSHFQKIAWKECDLLDLPKLERLLSGHRIVYHCAGLVSFHRKDFNRLIEINRQGTANMVNLSLSFGVDKFCHVSSTAAAGNKDILPEKEITEEGKWILTDETSGYSISKYSAEKEVWRGIEEGLNAVIANPSIIIGAGNWNESSMAIFKTIDKGLKFYSNGANAYVDARDVARIMVALMNKNIKGQRYLCVGKNTQFKTLFDLIAKELGKQPPKTQISKKMMGLAYRIAGIWAFFTCSRPLITKETALNAFKTVKFSNRKIKEELDYKFYSLEDSVKNAVTGRFE